MQKIVKHSGEVRITGIAQADGVAFRAERFYEQPSNFPFGTIATVHEDSTIKLGPWYWKTYQSPTQSKIRKYIQNTFIVTSILSLVFMLSHCFLNIYTETTHTILFNLSYVMISAMYLRNVTAVLVAKILGDQDVTNFSKFLAAKNAVQNAYYDLGKVPDIEEVKKYSLCSYYNDYLPSSDSAVGTLWLTFVIVRLIPLPWQVFVLLFASALIFILGKKNMLFFWQYLMISKPTDTHFKAAIAALEHSLSFI